MSNVQYLKKIADNLTEEQAKIIIQLIMEFDNDYVIPDKWEQKVIDRWEEMSEEERNAELIPAEEVYKDFGISQ